MARPSSRDRELPATPGAEDVVLCAGWQGSWPAVLAATPRGVVLLMMPHSEARISRVSLRNVLAVEEHREGRFTTVTLLTTRSTVVVTGVATGRAWTFCRALRAAILKEI